MKPATHSESPRFALTIWRTLSTPTGTLFSDDQSRRQTQIDKTGAGELVEPVFTWLIPDDPLAGIEDTEARECLQTQIVALRIDAPRETRTIGCLQSLLDKAREVLDGGTIHWNHSQAAADTGREEPLVNSLLALTKQLEWLMAVFKDLPNTWVSIR